MSDFWLTHAAPGTVAPAHLDKVRELHVIVRGWIEASAREQKNEHINANLPYVDLMFAFGFATLGDHAAANKLVEDARKVMDGPIPKGGSFIADRSITAGIVRNFLFKAFKDRGEQVLAGKTHAGPFSEAVNAEFIEITRIASIPPINNPHNLALYAIDGVRERSKILEPTARIDRYAGFSSHSPRNREYSELSAISDPKELPLRIRKLFLEGIPGQNLAGVQFSVLRESLRLTERLNEEFVVELLDWVAGTLLIDSRRGKEGQGAFRQAKLLEHAVVTALKLNRPEMVSKLIAGFVSLVETASEEDRRTQIHLAAPSCISSLKALGLRQEMDRLLTVLDKAVIDSVPLSEWRQRYWDRPVQWAGLLMASLQLVPGWFYLGVAERAQPVLSEARAALANSEYGFQSAQYAEIARSYVRALSERVLDGLDSIKELFSLMNPKAISNTFATAQFYSRLHLQLVEEAVLAMCRFCLENPVP
jgi:cellulose synthase operon protein C